MSQIILDLYSFHEICKDPGVVISIDYGINKIGIAISDPKMIIAMPYKVIETKRTKNFFDVLADIITVKKAICCVVGLPLHVDGTRSSQTELVEKFAHKLAKQIEVPIFFYDESYSSQIADVMLKDIGIKRKVRNKIDDSVAAQVILDGFLTTISRLRNKII